MSEPSQPEETKADSDTSGEPSDISDTPADIVFAEPSYNKEFDSQFSVGIPGDWELGASVNGYYTYWDEYDPCSPSATFAMITPDRAGHIDKQQARLSIQKLLDKQVDEQVLMGNEVIETRIFHWGTREVTYVLGQHPRRGQLNSCEAVYLIRDHERIGYARFYCKVECWKDFASETVSIASSFQLF